MANLKGKEYKKFEDIKHTERGGRSICRRRQIDNSC